MSFNMLDAVTKKKISESVKKLWQKPEYREKVTLKQRQKDRSGENNPFYGKKHTKETREIIKRKRQLQDMSSRIGIKHSLEARIKMSKSRRGKLIGSEHPNWKGGVSPINEKIRKSSEYKDWRISVFERDDYTCQFCGIRGNGELQADHIKSFALFPDLRFELNNGRTLCVPCHRKTKSYGRPYKLPVNQKVVC